MAIPVKFVTVVIRLETIERKYPGGINAYMKDYPIENSCRDLNLVGEIFMSTDEAGEFIEELVNLGFSYDVNGEFDEIAVVDEFRGLFLPCNWLETSIRMLGSSEVKESTCWLRRPSLSAEASRKHYPAREELLAKVQKLGFRVILGRKDCIRRFVEPDQNTWPTKSTGICWHAAMTLNGIEDCQVTPLQQEFLLKATERLMKKYPQEWLLEDKLLLQKRLMMLFQGI